MSRLLISRLHEQEAFFKAELFTSCQYFRELAMDNLEDVTKDILWIMIVTIVIAPISFYIDEKRVIK